jgi:hypothetical protein
MAASSRWASCRMSHAPGGIYLRESSGMMVWPLKVVVSQRWKMLFATQACEMSWRRMMARLPRGPPKLHQTTSFSPQTVRMIVGVRVSAPRRRIAKQARIHASIFLSVGSLRAKTAVRLVRETKSSSSML